LFEMMQVMIGSIGSFTDKCVRGVEANTEQATAWLERNAIIVTALNPVIGYAAGAALVKEALAQGRSVREVALEKAARGGLRHVDTGRQVGPEDVERALGDVRRLTEGGIVG
jgi:fumarate hydratase class II